MVPIALKIASATVLPVVRAPARVLFVGTERAAAAEWAEPAAVEAARPFVAPAATALSDGLAALLRDGRLDAPDLAGPAETEEES